jgi:tryptophan-rich sensory protein
MLAVPFAPERHMDKTSTSYRALVLAGFIAAAFMAALPAAFWPPAEWYAAIAKPSWNPPAWVFGPVWSTLYLMMGVAAWRIWRGAQPGREQALRLWWMQLFLNALWSPVFFGWHRLDLALLEILVLLGFIVATARAFGRIDRIAGALLLPYLAWVSFAAFLNFTLWSLNR